ncbi:ABC transporter substrate-binding protein [Comamonas faecalis]|uniref:ABC transporter substrate-binding protein n=1 Tax=Comamonas faecalis TaxID=1387849 RepID=A0ABP7QHQ7_9BURK
MKTSLKTMFAAAALCALSAQAQDAIRIGIEGAYPPFNAVDAKGQLYGFDVDIANALCAAMKAKCTLVAQDWDGMIPALVARKFDAVVSSMVNTEERSRRVDFTDPYYRTRLAVAVPKDSKIPGVDAKYMKGKTVGAQSSSTQGMYAEDVYGKAGADVRLYPTPDEAGADLIAGRLDAMVHDKFPLLEWLQKNSEGCCKLLGEIPGTEGDTSIALRKGDDALKQRFNQAIKDIRADGTYQKISLKYFGADIY